MRWTHLPAEADILAALNHAGVRAEDANQNQKRNWSERFANGWTLNPPAEMQFWSSPGAEGYTDFPFHREG